MQLISEPPGTRHETLLLWNDLQKIEFTDYHLINTKEDIYSITVNADYYEHIIRGGEKVALFEK